MNNKNNSELALDAADSKSDHLSSGSNSNEKKKGSRAVSAPNLLIPNTITASNAKNLLDQYGLIIEESKENSSSMPSQPSSLKKGFKLEHTELKGAAPTSPRDF